MRINFNQLVIPAGNQLLLNNIDWQTFESILTELGEPRSSRVSYSKGFLEIMVPSPDHELSTEIISNMVKILLAELNIEFWGLGAVTLTNEKIAQSVEPDHCFYLQAAAIKPSNGQLDLSQIPPPELAIEIDLTFRTHLGNYEALGIPELWRYNGKILQINLLRAGRYVTATTSQLFSQFLWLPEIIAQSVEQSKRRGRYFVLKTFPDWVRKEMMMISNTKI